MTKKLPTIVYFGNEQLATGIRAQAPLLQALLGAGYTIAAVVLSKKTSAHRQVLTPVEVLAREYNIPVLTPHKATDIAAQLLGIQADVGVLAAYGKIVPESVIRLFPAGIVNIHPSLLPAYRGSTPIEQALLDGQSETGVSLMALSAKMDAGGIYAVQKVAVLKDCTKQQLYDLIVDKATTLLVDSLPKICSGELVAVPQNEQQATYTPRLKKEDGLINWQKPAEALEREIRAFAVWPGSQTQLGGLEVTITAAHTVPGTGHLKPGSISITSNAHELHVGTSNGFLAIDRIKPASKAEMDIRGFINGYQARLKNAE